MSEGPTKDYISEARQKIKEGQAIFRHQSVDNILHQAELIKFENIALRTELTTAQARIAQLEKDLNETMLSRNMYLGLYRGICFPLKPDPPFIVGS